MHIKKLEIGKRNIIVVTSEEVVVYDAQSAMDIVLTMGYDSNCDCFIFNKEAISKDFYRLKTNIAGEILQKFSNYHISIAIVGDFLEYLDSNSFHDFVYECNTGNTFFFAHSEEEAIEMLTNT